MSWLTIAKSNSDLISSLKKYQLIKSDLVFKAMSRVDRGHFCDHITKAYYDVPLPIGYDATISAPHMHAYALEDLVDHIHPGSKILDVGSGSGYLCAVFAAMLDELEKDTEITWTGRGQVVGVEIIPELVKKSKRNLEKFPEGKEWLKNGRIEIHHGSGWDDLKSYGPFDAIHVGAAAEEVPQKLMSALKPGGRCVIPVGEEDNSQFYKVIDKLNNGDINAQTKMEVRFVPLVKDNH